MWPPTGLIPCFSKTEGNTYATLLHHPFLFRDNQRNAQEVAIRISGAVAGEVYAKVNIPSTHHKPLSPALHYFPFASRFPLPHFTLAILFALWFPMSSSLSCLPFSCYLSVCSCASSFACLSSCLIPYPLLCLPSLKFFTSSKGMEKT